MARRQSDSESYNRQTDGTQDTFILSRSAGYHPGGVVPVGWTCQNRLGVDNGSSFHIKTRRTLGWYTNRSADGKQREVDRD
jgi:hypothetical protein